MMFSISLFSTTIPSEHTLCQIFYINYLCNSFENLWTGHTSLQNNTSKGEKERMCPTIFPSLPDVLVHDNHNT